MSQVYRFGGPIVLSPLRQQRETNERRTEELHFQFQHHNNPLRELQDVAYADVLVRAPHMTNEQQKAFVTALDMRFGSFTCDLRSSSYRPRAQIAQKSNLVDVDRRIHGDGEL